MNRQHFRSRRFLSLCLDHHVKVVFTRSECCHMFEFLYRVQIMEIDQQICHLLSFSIYGLPLKEFQTFRYQLTFEKSRMPALEGIENKQRLQT